MRILTKGNISGLGIGADAICIGANIAGIYVGPDSANYGSLVWTAADRLRVFSKNDLALYAGGNQKVIVKKDGKGSVL